MVAIKSLIEGLSLRDKAAQVIFPAYTFDAPDNDGIADLVKKGVGGLCIYRGSVFEVPGFLNGAQKSAKLPLLICSDFEDGAGEQVKGGTMLPTNMAIGASGMEEVARFKGIVTATEARAVGVHWNFSPVVDINSNPMNPIINTRTFGDSPELITKLAAAYMKGLTQGKMLNCIKHFPGHGDVDTDSHIALPSLAHDRSRVEGFELKPFFDLAPLADSIMTAHMLVPAYDPKYPATISKEISYRLIREKMKYDGLVVTDALIMAGITTVAPEEEVLILALQAGADVLLFPQDPWLAIDAVINAVESKKLDPKILDIACARILKAKEKVGLFESRQVSASEIEKFLASPTNRKSATLIAEASITLVKDEQKLLPLKPGRTGYFALVDNTASDTEDQFIKHLSKHAGAVEAEEGDFDLYVVGLFIKPRAMTGRTMFDDSEVARVMDKVKAGKKVVLVSFGNPYVIRQFPGVTTYVCAYSDCDATQEAAARVLAGKAPFKGKLPVKIPAEFFPKLA
jgi:beta-N-acetylhexosaminidase